MKNIRIETWDRTKSFNGVDLEILKANLPTPCLLVYVDGLPIGAEDGNYRTSEELMEIYQGRYNQDDPRSIESLEDTVRRLDKEKSELEIALIELAQKQSKENEYRTQLEVALVELAAKVGGE